MSGTALGANPASEPSLGYRSLGEGTLGLMFRKLDVLEKQPQEEEGAPQLKARASPPHLLGPRGPALRSAPARGAGPERGLGARRCGSRRREERKPREVLDTAVVSGGPAGLGCGVGRGGETIKPMPSFNQKKTKASLWLLLNLICLKKKKGRELQVEELQGNRGLLPVTGPSFPRFSPQSSRTALCPGAAAQYECR